MSIVEQTESEPDRIEARTPRQVQRAVSFGWPVTILTVCAALLVNPNPDPDFWGHVRYGRDVFQHGFPWTSTYTYTAEGYPWINHENLAELSFAIGVDWFGVPAVLAVKCAVGVALMGLLLNHLRRNRCSWLAAGAMTLFVAVNLTGYWTVRPQAFSFVGFALLLEILSRAWPNREDEPDTTGTGVRSRWLMWLPLVLAAWANSHGGFLAGVFTLGLYLTVRAVESIWRGDNDRWRAAGLACGVGAVSLLATLATPYGIRLLIKLYHKLVVPRPEVSEWHAPHWNDPIHLPFFLLIGLAVCCVAWTKRRRDIAPLVVLAAILWQSLTHARHIPFFALTVGWFLAPHWASLFDRVARFLRGPRLVVMSPPSPSPLAAHVIASLASLAMLVSFVAPQLQAMPVSHAEYPVAAVRFLRQHELLGKMVVAFNWSQYIIDTFGSRDPNQPGMTVQFDGRFRTCYPQEMLDLHFDFILGEHEPGSRYRSPKSPPCDPARVLAYQSPDLVLIDRSLGHAVATMRLQGERWTLLYQDSLSQLWGRSSRYNDPASPHFFPPSKRLVSNEPQTGFTAWPAHAP